MGPGVLAGGDKGFSHRNRIYASFADWTLYAADYVPETLPFTKFRDEPYPPRHGWTMQVKLSVESCKEAEGDWKQTESLAAVGTQR